MVFNRIKQKLAKFDRTEIILIISTAILLLIIFIAVALGIIKKKCCRRKENKLEMQPIVLDELPENTNNLITNVINEEKADMENRETGLTSEPSKTRETGNDTDERSLEIVRQELLAKRRNELYYTLIALQAHQNSYLYRKAGLISLPVRFLCQKIQNANRFLHENQTNFRNLDFHDHPYYNQQKFIAFNDYSNNMKRSGGNFFV